jgi:hypothetical protein
MYIIIEYLIWSIPFLDEYRGDIWRNLLTPFYARPIEVTPSRLSEDLYMSFSVFCFVIHKNGVTPLIILLTDLMVYDISVELKGLKNIDKGLNAI